MDNIAERIREKAKKKGLNIKQLELLSGLSNGQIGKWANQNSSFEKLASVAKHLNTSVDWLITGKEPGELTTEEKKLIEHYRNANETSKQMIMSMAQIADQSEDKSQISTSAVG